MSCATSFKYNVYELIFSWLWYMNILMSNNRQFTTFCWTLIFMFFIGRMILQFQCQQMKVSTTMYHDTPNIHDIKVTWKCILEKNITQFYCTKLTDSFKYKVNKCSHSPKSCSACLWKSCTFLLICIFTYKYFFR